MKIFHHILIIAAVLLLLYVVRDDVKVAYNHVTTYLKDEIKGTATPAQNIAGTAQSNTSTNGTQTVETPGPLRAASQFLGLSTVSLSAKNVITLTNQQRHDNGNLPALKENAKLDATAKKKLQDMFAKQYFQHVSPDGVGVANLADQEGYEYVIIGENLALGNFKDDAALVAAWMASPGHRANILNTKYTDIGVAVGEGTFEGKTTWLAVQHFGLPRNACPAIDEVLHGTIEANQKQIDTMDADLAVRRQHIEDGTVYNGQSQNEQINAYNNIVAQYNALITDTKAKITTYNAEVNAFNACVTANTPAKVEE